MNKVFGVVLGLCIACSAQAGGYRAALQGQKALGMGHTGVAMTDSAESIFFNPGAITQLEADIDMVADNGAEFAEPGLDCLTAVPGVADRDLLVVEPEIRKDYSCAQVRLVTQNGIANVIKMGRLHLVKEDDEGFV